VNRTAGSKKLKTIKILPEHPIKLLLPEPGLQKNKFFSPISLAFNKYTKIANEII
jgi:hypothetical protein